MNGPFSGFQMKNSPQLRFEGKMTFYSCQHVVNLPIRFWELLDALYSIYALRSMFYATCLLLNVRCSVFDVRCFMLYAICLIQKFTHCPMPYTLCYMLTTLCSMFKKKKNIDKNTKKKVLQNKEEWRINGINDLK